MITAKGDEELQHELADSLPNVHRLVDNLRESHARGQCARDLLLFRIQRSAQIQSVPTVLHHDAEYQRGLAIVTDQEGRRVFVTTFDLGDIRKSERTTAGGDRRIADLLQIIVGAIEAYEHLRPVRIDRAGGSHGVLTLERVKNVSRTDTEIRQPGIGEVDEDALRALALDVDLLDARYVKKALPECLGFTGELSRRHAVSLERVDGEDDIRVLVVDKRSLHPGGKFGRLIAEFLARLIELLGNRGRLESCRSA